MEKEIRMPYKEFLEMKGLIEKQAECIEQLKENPLNTFIDSRYIGGGCHWNHFGVLKVVSQNEAVSILKESLDEANTDLHSMTDRILELEKEVKNLETENRKKWWNIKK